MTNPRAENPEEEPSLGPFSGKKHSEESKAKMSASRTGKPRNQSPVNSTLQRIRVMDAGFHTQWTGSMWITNGVDNKRIRPEQIHEHAGYWAGRTVGEPPAAGGV